MARYSFSGVVRHPSGSFYRSSEVAIDTDDLYEAIVAWRKGIQSPLSSEATPDSVFSDIENLGRIRLYRADRKYEYIRDDDDDKRSKEFEVFATTLHEDFVDEVCRRYPLERYIRRSGEVDTPEDEDFVRMAAKHLRLEVCQGSGGLCRTTVKLKIGDYVVSEANL